MATPTPYNELVFSWDSDHSQSLSEASTPVPQPTYPPYLDTEKVSCSAFSMWAKPSEDWTKIRDADERRRVQNRIAQRYYRKKTKQKLEYLEENWRRSLDLPWLSPPRRPRSRLSDPGHIPPHVWTSSTPRMQNDYTQLSFWRQGVMTPAPNTNPPGMEDSFPCTATLLDLSAAHFPSETIAANTSFPSATASSHNALAGDYTSFPDSWFQSGPPTTSFAQAGASCITSLEREAGHFDNAGTYDPYQGFSSFPSQSHAHPPQSNVNNVRPRSMPTPQPQVHCYADYRGGGE